MGSTGRLRVPNESPYLENRYCLLGRFWFWETLDEEILDKKNYLTLPFKGYDEGLSPRPT